MNKPRIAIYGTGQFGQKITRLAIEKGWTIIAAYNRAGEKVGQDLGQLAGLGRDLGIIVEDCETANYDRLDADIGVVTLTNHLHLNLPAYQRLIKAGINVLCHGTESYYPYGNNEVIAAEIDSLAKQHGVTFTGSGIWDMSRIWAGILVAGPCTEMKSLFHSSITDLAAQAINKEQMAPGGVGLTVEQFREKGLCTNPVLTSYKTIPEQVLVALGYTISHVNVSIEPATLTVDVECHLLDEPVPAGNCLGSKMVADIKTVEGVTARAEIEIRLFAGDEVEHMFWEVDGLPTTRVRTERDNSAHATAACLFNRIPDVIAAEPGIALLSQLGPLKHTALVR